MMISSPAGAPGAVPLPATAGAKHLERALLLHGPVGHGLAYRAAVHNGLDDPHVGAAMRGVAPTWPRS